MKQTAFCREKNGECRECLKYSVPIFVEQIYKMQRLEVSGVVRPLYGSLGVKRLIGKKKKLWQITPVRLSANLIPNVQATTMLVLGNAQL